MGVPAHFFLLTDEHLNKGFLLIRALDRLEQLFLAFRHRAPDAMPLAAEFANVDTGRRDFLAHE